MYTEDEIYAILAEISYNKHELLHDHYGLIDYNIDEDLSSENSTIILTPDGKAVISYRGTDVHNPSDLVADAGIALGLSHLPQKFKPARFQEAEDTYQKVIEKYPDKQVVTTGHSLGGHQSLMVAKDHGLEGHHFNIGSSLLDAGVQMKNFIKCAGNGDASCQVLKKQNIYTTGSDILSISMLPRLTKMFGQENVSFKKPKKDVDFLHHSLTHFLPEPKQIAEQTNKEIQQIKQEIKQQDPIKFSILSIRDTDNFCISFPNHPVCEKSIRKIKYSK